MKNDDEKGLPPPSAPCSETLASGRGEVMGPADRDGAQDRRGRPKQEPLNHPDFERLRLTLDDQCANLKRDFDRILSYPRLAREAVKYIARRIVPAARIGRPRTHEITEAVPLRASGEPWRVIYPRLGKGTRDDQFALREAVRQRNRRAKRKP